MKKLITALLIAAQLFCILIPVGAVSAPEADGFVSKEGETSLLGNDISFFVPNAADNVITQSAKVENQTYTAGSNTKNIAVSLIKNGAEQSIENVAYVAYKIKNNGAQVINIGTRLNLKSGETRQAGATAPLCFDAQTGAKLNLTDSWSYSSNKLISDKSLATVEIPAGAEIYMVLPITSVNDSERYVPAIEKSATAFDEKAKTDGNLRARNADATKYMGSMYTDKGYLNLVSLDIYYNGSGASRDCSNPVSYEVSGVYFMTREDYTLKTAETNVSLLKSPLRFFMPDQSKNLMSTPTVANEVTHSNSSNSVTVNIAESDYTKNSIDELAYATYKLTNNGTSVMNVGTRLGLKGSKNTSNAGATLPIVYDAVTGERLNYVDSWTYSSNKLISDSTVVTVEIPAGASVYIVVPMTSVNDDSASRSVPTLEKVTDAFSNTQKTAGNLRVRTSHATQIQTNAAAGDHYLSYINIYVAGSGATRDYANTFSYEISGLWTMTRQEYTERYTEMNFAMDNGASVYMNQKAGIRFTSCVNSADYYYLVDRYGKDNVSFGTLITPAAYVQAAGALTFEALNALDTQVYGDVKYLDVKATEFFSENGAELKIAGSVVDIKTANYNLAFSSVSYIKIVDGDNVIYIYADGVQTRSIAQVAQLAVADRSAAQTEAYANYIGDGNANGEYSPYTPEQINILKGFYS